MVCHIDCIVYRTAQTRGPQRSFASSCLPVGYVPDTSKVHPGVVLVLPVASRVLAVHGIAHALPTRGERVLDGIDDGRLLRFRDVGEVRRLQRVGLGLQ